MKKEWKIALWAVGVLAGLVVLATLVAAPVAKGYINRHGEDLVGRRLHVEQLRLNVYTGHLALRGVSLYEDDGEAVFAGFDTLDVKAHLLKLIGKKVYLKHVTLSGLHANVVKTGERFNFNSLIDHFAPADTTAERDTTPSGWAVELHNLRLSHAGVDYRDTDNGKHWRLPDINLRVPGFVLGGKERSQGGLNIGFAEGGRLNVEADYNAADNGFKVGVGLDGFALANLTSLATDFVRVDDLAGTLDVQLEADGNLDDAAACRISGTVGVDGLALRRAGSPIASLQSLRLRIAEIDLGKNLFDVQELALDGLEATYEQWDGHNTISDLLVAPQQAATDSTTASQPRPAADSTRRTPPMTLKVGRLALANANLTYCDHTLPDPFRFPVTGLSVEAQNLATASANEARLRASLPGGGKVVVNWKGRIDNWKQQQDLFLMVKALDMKQLSPWLVAYTGQPVEDGVFGLTSHNTISNSNLNGSNKVDLYKLTVGSRRSDVEAQYKLPLKAALYVLKDKDGKIKLDVPVKGNIDNPEFSYMKLVWKTLGNLLVKVATSPARAIANAMGMGGADIDFIAIAPTQRGLESEQYHQLGQLAEIAAYDSLVVLNLEQQMPDTDSTGHHREMLNGMVRQYLLEQGVRENQISISVSDTVGKRTGYAVSSELKVAD